MSVLNKRGEEQQECPLCMEPLEVDDLNFFPCTCGYQICRFCWHRIRNDENGLCPACRKAYEEDPADFTPLTQEEMAKLKAEKRQRDQQRKAKITESRKHLASVRVVQKNLVFVVGLPLRLAEAEVLKRHEYFGKFGRIHKVVINQSTSYAGSSGPSASAYVTYMKSDDALRAIQYTNNIHLDGRVLKCSLGTTKYCSHFMKNQPCPKPDCMYLHDFGDPEASFTKEQMHAGKHQEYEKKLHDQLQQRSQQHQSSGGTQSAPTSKPTSKSKEPPTSSSSAVTPASSSSNNSSKGTNKENWPQLNNGEKEKPEIRKTENSKDRSQKGKGKSKGGGGNADNRKEKVRNCDSQSSNSSSSSKDRLDKLDSKPNSSSAKDSSEEKQTDNQTEKAPDPTFVPKVPLVDDNSSFFSQNPYQKIIADQNSESESPVVESTEITQPMSILTDSLPDIHTSEDWVAAFGLSDDNLLELKQPNKEEPTHNNPFTNGYNPFLHPHFNNGFYDVTKNQPDSVSYKNGYYTKPDVNQLGLNQNGKVLVNRTTDNLDQISRLLMDAANRCGQQRKYEYNGENGQNGIGNYFINNDMKNLLSQQELEEQLLQLSINGRYCEPQKASAKPLGLQGNGLLGQHQARLSAGLYLNGLKEDELDFDPIQETQKAFAELMAAEQTALTGHSNVPTNHLNGISHNHSGLNHLPPPPPGFVQQNTHMNSFGSKILPFLNMSNSQQQINGTTPGSWPNGYSQFQQLQTQQQLRSQQTQLRPQFAQQPQQLKSVNNCHDWKTLDPAILSSSRHFPLANMPPVRDHYTLQQQLESQQNNSLRYLDYSSFSQINTQQNLNWFTSELNSQINSPPGFRTATQATKQQEC